jgi:hypothetical protein
MTTFTDTVTDALAAAGTQSSAVNFGGSAAEVVTFPFATNTLTAGYGLTCTSSAALTSSGTYVWTAGASISEALGVRGSLGVNQVLVQVLAQSLGLSDLLVAGRPVTVAESFNLTGSLTALLGALLADRLNIVTTNAPALTYKQTLLEFVRLNDAAAKFLAGAILESLGIAPSYTAVARVRPTVSETASIASTISTKLLAIVVESDTISVSDADALKMVFKPTVSEAFRFELALIEPNGGFTTWAVNTRTGATTEYQNYAFNSFAVSGHRSLGASTSGLYVLDGDDDDGAATVATLRSGYAQFGGSRYSSFKSAYLGIRGEDDIYLKLEAGTGESYTYQVKLQNQQTTKVRIGKGLRARYFAWELVTTGQDFDLDSVEFVPLVAQRRV